MTCFLLLGVLKTYWPARASDLTAPHCLVGRVQEGMRGEFPPKTRDSCKADESFFARIVRYAYTNDMSKEEFFRYEAFVTTSIKILIESLSR